MFYHVNVAIIAPKSKKSINNIDKIVLTMPYVPRRYVNPQTIADTICIIKKTLNTNYVEYFLSLHVKNIVKSAINAGSSLDHRFFVSILIYKLVNTPIEMNWFVVALRLW